MIDHLARYCRYKKDSMFYGGFEGMVPFLDGSRRSFDSLLPFLLERVIDYFYDAKVKYFRPAPSFCCSNRGLRSDTYELVARTFIGAAYFLVHGDSERLSDVYLEVIRDIMMETECEGDNIILTRWRVGAIPSLQAYSTIVPVNSGVMS